MFGDLCGVLTDAADYARAPGERNESGLARSLSLITISSNSSRNGAAQGGELQAKFLPSPLTVLFFGSASRSTSRARRKRSGCTLASLSISCFFELLHSQQALFGGTGKPSSLMVWMHSSTPNPHSTSGCQ